MSLTQFDEQRALCRVSPIATDWGADFGPICSNLQQDQRIDDVIFCSTDTIDHEVQIAINFPGSDLCILGTLLVPTLAGTQSDIPPVSLISELPIYALGIVVQTGLVLSVKPVVEVSADTFL
jgi:hypothetical protein